MPKTNLFFITALCLLVTALIFNLSLGSVSIPLKEVIMSLFGGDVEKETWRYIVTNYRLPKALTAILVGCGLSISGLLMQTLFRNPLAGPYVLGISSGASLGVALVIMGASLFGGSWAVFLGSNYSIVIASSLGSFIVLLAVVIAASRLRDTMAILIIGLMFASLTASVVSVLAYFAPANQLQQYIFWSYGSLGNLSWQELSLLAAIISIGILLSIFCLKNLNALLLGENYARSLGVNVKKNRFLVITATSLLAGSITAFAGPIAFVGLAVPHLVRQVFPVSDHRLLMPAVCAGGAITMLVSDTIAQLPTSAFTLPINAITSLVGAPVVIWLLVRKRRLHF